MKPIPLTNLQLRRPAAAFWGMGWEWQPSCRPCLPASLLLPGSQFCGVLGSGTRNRALLRVCAVWLWEGGLGGAGLLSGLGVSTQISPEAWEEPLNPPSVPPPPPQRALQMLGFFGSPSSQYRSWSFPKRLKPSTAREDVNGGLDGNMGLGFQNTKHQSCIPTTSTLPIRSKRGSKTYQPDLLFRWGAQGPHGGTVTARSCGKAVPLSPQLGPQGGAGLSIWPWLYLPHMWIPLSVPHGRLTTLVMESSL